MKFHAVTTVWGETFTNRFLNVCLPNQLTSGNIPALASAGETVYKVFTTERDAKLIQQHNLFKELSRIVRTEIITADHLFTSCYKSQNNSLAIMTRLHAMAVAAAAAEDAAILFMTADTLFSKGAFGRAAALAIKGKRAIFLVSPRLTEETFLPAFRKAAPNEKALTARDLTRLALSHLHEFTKRNMVDSNSFTHAPVYALWPVGKEGFVARCLYLHTLMIYPRDKSALPVGGFDTDFPLRAGLRKDEFYIVTDSDDIAMFELSEKNKEFVIMKNNRFDFFSYAEFLRTHGESLHYRFLSQPILMHGEEISDAWSGAVKASQKTVSRALLFNRLFFWR